MLNYLISLSRPIKRIITLSIDVILLLSAFWFAFWVRIDSMTPIFSTEHWLFIFSIIIVTLAIFVKLGLYRAVIRYITAKILLVVTVGMVISSILLIIAAFYTNLYLPRTIPFIYFSFGLLLIAGSRLGMRMLVNRGLNLGTRVVIYGAGASGRQLLPALSQMDEYYPVAFVDDNRALQGGLFTASASSRRKNCHGWLRNTKRRKFCLPCQAPAEPERTKSLKRWKAYHARCSPFPEWSTW